MSRNKAVKGSGSNNKEIKKFNVQLRSPKKVIHQSRLYIKTTQQPRSQDKALQ